MWLVCNCKNGVSSYELGRDLGVTQTTAWLMLHRIRLTMQTEPYGKMAGTVEADETFIGGKAQLMHESKRVAKMHGRGAGGSGKPVKRSRLNNPSPQPRQRRGG